MRRDIHIATLIKQLQLLQVKCFHVSYQQQNEDDDDDIITTSSRLKFASSGTFDVFSVSVHLHSLVTYGTSIRLDNFLSSEREQRFNKVLEKNSDLTIQMLEQKTRLRLCNIFPVYYHPIVVSLCQL